MAIWDLASNSSRTVLETDQMIEAPNWSPCGTYLLVNGNGGLFRVPLADPKLVAVDLGGLTKLNNDHGISPDGTMFVISSHHRGKGAEIYSLPATGGQPKMITQLSPSWWHGWSPDGNRLTYVAARNGSRVIDVYTIGVNGGEETRLTQGEGHHDGPDYSADGSKIYYNCDRDGHAQIWVIDVDGSNPQKLFADEYVNWFPHPSPDGQHLIWLAYPPGTLGHPPDLPVAICLGTPDGQNRKRLIEFNGGQGTMNVPNWSPDSTAFAYVDYAAPV